MRVLAVIINLFLPGIGTLFVGKIGTGIIQIILFWFGAILSLTLVFSFIGIPMMVVVWIWSIVSAVQSPQPSVHVVVTHRNEEIGADGQNPSDPSP